MFVSCVKQKQLHFRGWDFLLSGSFLQDTDIFISKKVTNTITLDCNLPWSCRVHLQVNEPGI